MNLPTKKRPRNQVKNRKKTGTFNLGRLLSFVVLLLILVISFCAVGYVIFFRTVVAQEILPTLRNTVVFEEPDPPGHGVEVTAKPIEEKAVDIPLEKSYKKSELPKVAIIIDDMGYDEGLGEQLLNSSIELTYSFLPFAPHTKKLENLAYLAEKTVFLHLPLEPKESTFNPGPGALFLHDSLETQREKFKKCLQAVPHAVGVNNHMGSSFTEDKQAMANLIQEIKDRSLMFVDSFTTSGSIGYQVARQATVKSARRSVFLDNTLEEEKICDQLEQLVAIAEKYGLAIGIGHPHRETINALSKCSEKYLTRVQYVGATAALWQ
jgi:polysaccharide deacetylase 2 family uncharacterized protein YibQ